MMDHFLPFTIMNASRWHRPKVLTTSHYQNISLNGSDERGGRRMTTSLFDQAKLPMKKLKKKQKTLNSSLKLWQRAAEWEMGRKIKLKMNLRTKSVLNCVSSSVSAVAAVFSASTHTRNIHWHTSIEHVDDQRLLAARHRDVHTQP